MSEDDPFENLDVPDDREGDPFEHLDGPPEEEVSPADAGLPFEDDPAEAESHEPETADEPSPSVSSVDTAPTVDPPQAGERDRADPFAGMADREGDPFGDAESVFESMDVGSVDPEGVWASLDEDAETPEPTGSRYADVSKHRYCEQCEHFSGPPEIGCAHEGTEIVEFLDMETVRLRNCPVVAEQRELGNEE